MTDDANPEPTTSPTFAGGIAPCRLPGGRVGPGHPPLLIAGPCVIESRDMALRHAEAIKAIAEASGFLYCFKSSFDKANRTSVTSYRGPGLEKGLDVLAEVRRETGAMVLTDFHTPDQARPVAEVADILQIPAFLCRQTDMLVAAAETGKAVNVKKGQFLAPESMRPAVEKIRSAGGRDILLTERGATFGYGNLVVDFRSIPIMRSFGVPVVFDATHSVQRPGGLGDRSGGDRTEVPHLLRAAAAVGVDGFFMEVHEDPDNALSDGPNMIELENLAQLLGTVRAIRQALGQDPVESSAATVS